MALALTAIQDGSRTLAERTDDQLMGAFARKDRRAFDQLYERYKGPLYGYLYKNCRDDAATSEMFQDVWVRVIASAPRYQQAGRFRSWLFTLAHNRLVDFYRRPEIEVELTPDRLTAQEEVESEVSNRQQAEKLALLLNALPIDQRQAFYLREECGFAVKEIAEVQGISIEAAKSRLRYAYGKLREAYRGEK